MINMDIFKSPRRLRVEKKRRYEERNEKKQELDRLKCIYNNRDAKIMNMKRIEKSKSFQNDFNKMKEMFKKPEPMFNDELKVYPKKKRDMFSLEL